MKVASIRELKHDTTAVLSWVANGETVEVRRHNRLVAILSPPATRTAVVRPDFAARLRTIYGTKRLATTGTVVVGQSRGES